MLLPAKHKSFWSRSLPWLKRLALLAVAWPLVATLIYAFVPVPITNLMLYRLFSGQGLDKSWRSFGQISPHLARAIVAAEDQRFCAHHGVDWAEMKDAFESGDRGASTISMQVAKNLYLWEGRSAIRKGLELPLAFYMDIVLGKRRMMEIYLNIAEWAPGVYGAEAASQYHFGKSALKLSAHEAALLAASLPNPIKRDAGEPSAALRGVASHIQNQMGEIDLYLTCLK